MPTIEYEVVDDGILGVLPNGDEELFDSEEEYEDACYDMFYDMQNCDCLEWPEDWIA